VCTLFEVARSALSYQGRKAARDAPVVERMREVSAQYQRSGYRRIRIFLGRDGCRSPGRAYRLWRTVSLQLPRKRRGSASLLLGRDLRWPAFARRSESGPRAELRDVRSVFVERPMSLLRFRPGRNDDPIYWQFGYDHSKRKTNNGLETAKTLDTISDNLKALFGGGTLDVKEYNPSHLSDYKIRITDLYVYGKRKDLKAINRVEMTVTLASRY
jgi:hypothetical protein